MHYKMYGILKGSNINDKQRNVRGPSSVLITHTTPTAPTASFELITILNRTIQSTTISTATDWAMIDEYSHYYHYHNHHKKITKNGTKLILFKYNQLIIITIT